mgnify:CR=1 FL=1
MRHQLWGPADSCAWPNKPMAEFYQKLYAYSLTVTEMSTS